MCHYSMRVKLLNQLNIKWCKDHVTKGLYGKHQSTNKHILGNHTETVKIH